MNCFWPVNSIDEISNPRKQHTANSQLTNLDSAMMSREEVWSSGYLNQRKGKTLCEEAAVLASPWRKKASPMEKEEGRECSCRIHHRLVPPVEGYAEARARGRWSGTAKYFRHRRHRWTTQERGKGPPAARERRGWFHRWGKPRKGQTPRPILAFWGPNNIVQPKSMLGLEAQ
jgi:hypothetical protein